MLYETLKKMKAPGDRRDVWRGGVLQIKSTNACDLSCCCCSVGVGLAKKLKKVFYMPPDAFRLACESLKGYSGVVGLFGGNVCLHPQFDALCQILRESFPQEQCGLWSNRLFGHGATCARTFNPRYSNLNVHGSQEAYDEMLRDWPESQPIGFDRNRPGHDPSRHGPIFGSMLDLGLTEEQMWQNVAGCCVNQTWSAEITYVNGKLAGYFCEIAATMAELTGDDSSAMAVKPGWWNQPMAAFEHQVRQACPRCLIPLNGYKEPADGGIEKFTATWSTVMLSIKGRNLRQATCLDQITNGRGNPATRYLG